MLADPKKAPEGQKEEQRPASNVLLDFARDVALVALAMLLGYLIAYNSVPATPQHFEYPMNTVLFITAGDTNDIQPLIDYAEAHGLAPAVWNLDTAPAYITLGDRNIPLTPPVVTLPTYICRAADRNTIAGYSGTDLNIFKLVVQHCYGYQGPRYVYDQNTQTVVEVNS